MNYYTYIIRFKSGYWYIGKRATKHKPELDSYTGSGKLLRKYKRKYTDQFEKVIIQTYENEAEAYYAEEILIGDWWESKYSLNLKPGGKGAASGKDHHMYCRTGELNPMYGKNHTEESNKANREKHLGKAIHTEEHKKSLSEKYKTEFNPLYGKSGSEHPKFGVKISSEAKSKIGEKLKGRTRYCNLEGHIIFTRDIPPDGYYSWNPNTGFSDKTLRVLYPKALRGKWFKQ